jgi:hypothetical protein
MFAQTLSSEQQELVREQQELVRENEHLRDTLAQVCYLFEKDTCVFARVVIGPRSLCLIGLMLKALHLVRVCGGHVCV